MGKGSEKAEISCLPVMSDLVHNSIATQSDTTGRRISNTIAAQCDTPCCHISNTITAQSDTPGRRV